MKRIISILIAFSFISVHIPKNAFAQGEIIFDEEIGVYYNTSSGEIVKCDAELSGDFTVPGYIEETKITSIGPDAFSDCYNLNSVYIPENITIANSAFAYSYVKKVTLPKTLASIPENCFCSAENLEEINIPDCVARIESGAFAGCKSLKNVTLPENLEYIGTAAFSECTSITSVFIPKSVTSGGEYWFNYCDNLKTVTFEEGTERILCRSFDGVTGLQSINFPDSLITIEEGAFSNCPLLKKLDLPKNLKIIDYNAFSWCSSLTDVIIPASVEGNYGEIFSACENLETIVLEDGIKIAPPSWFGELDNLKTIIIPESVTQIDDLAFRGDLPELTVHCAEGDVARSAIRSRANVSITKQKTKFENIADAEYRIIESTIPEYTSFEIKFKILNNNPSSYRAVCISIPDDAEVVESVYLNGKKTDDYYEYYDIVRNFYIDLRNVESTENEIEIKFSIKTDGYMNINSYAEYICDSPSITEMIGAVSTVSPALTMSVPATVGNTEVFVSGYTTPDTEVVFYMLDESDEEQKIGQTMSLKTGKYTTYITLGNPENYKRYTLIARAQTQDGEKEVIKRIKYDSGIPKVTSLVMQTSAHDDIASKIDFMDENQKPQNIILAPGIPLKFYTSFDSNENVGNVAVVAINNGRKSYIDAKWDEKQNCFVAEGNFGEYFAPKEITVEYTKKNDFEITETIDPVMLNQYFDESMKNNKVEIISDTDEEYHQIVKIGEEGRELLCDEIDYVIKTTAKEYTDSVIGEIMTDTDTVHSYFFDTESDKYILSLDTSDPETVVMVVHDISSSKMVTHIVSTFDEIDGKMPPVEALGNLSQATGTILDAYDIYNDDKDLREQIASSGLTAEEKRVALKKVDSLQSDRAAFLLATLAIGAFTAPIAGPTAVAFSLLFGAMTTSADFFWEQRMGNILSQNALITCNWIIDPSGYVYEGYTDNRIEGVTTTVYWIAPEFIDENGDFDEANAVLWDSAPYEQQNPLTTDSEGRYGWFVPEGMWQVKFEKEGYHEAYSEWLPVPPVQTEVNIGMISYDKPIVEYAKWDGTKLNVRFSKPVIPSTIDCLEILDENNNLISFNAYYDVNQKHLNGNNYCRDFSFQLDRKPKTIKTSSEILSYANIGMNVNTIEVTIDGVYSEYSSIEKSVNVYSENSHADVYIIASSYKSDKMIDICIKITDINAGVNKVLFDELITDESDCIKVFVWKDGIFPLSN